MLLRAKTKGKQIFNGEKWTGLKTYGDNYCELMRDEAMIDVCAAVIVNPKEKLVFLAKRPENSHLAGFWEFPGGKMEKGESPKECLVRELKEELDVSAKVGSFICESVYHYSEKTVRLLAYWVMIDEKPKLKEHDSFMWVKVEEFDFASLAPADRIVAKEVVNLLNREGGAPLGL